ncbi:MAG: SWIM zinc finger family protein [Mycetocola sp.]
MQQRYVYAGESAVRRDGDGARVGFSTSGGLDAHPFFFSGFLARPRLSAALLLSVSKVAGTRFYVPAAVIQAVIRAADPVVTSDGGQLRFESFSVCNGVYARADFSGDALDDGFLASGTTNVDFNPPMRNALARLRDTDAVHLSVGADDVTISTLRETIVERKVPLPARWLRGFAEVQLVQVGMTPRFDLDTARARRFLSVVARERRKGDWWAAPSASGVTLAAAPLPGAVRIAGLERLKLLANHAREARGLRVWATDDDADGATAWELEVPDSRLTLALSPQPNRGFSGEGNVLRDVVDDAVVVLAERLRPQITGVARIDTTELAQQTGEEVEVVNRALNVLASSGVVGFDLSTCEFFSRELPFDADAMALLHPRLQGARSLGPDAVVILERTATTTVAAVAGRTANYVVRASGAERSCTCPWYEKHAGSRGPCKHVLAFELLEQGVS